MARIATRTEPVARLAAPSLTAATHAVSPAGGSNAGGGITPASSWSVDAWNFYDTIGELRYVCQWLSNSLSRVNIITADVDRDGKPTSSTEDDRAASIVADIAGGPAGQAQLLNRLATFLTVPGEGWVGVITRTEPDTGAQFDEWHVLSTDEVRKRGSSVVLELDDGKDHEFNPERDILTRVYRPHPRRSRDADSPVRAALPILAEIQRTSETIDGASKSRLAGNGILAVPQEISMPVQQAPKGQRDAPGLEGEPEIVTQQVSAQDLMQQLQKVMTAAIRDHTSAAAMVPIVLQAPGELIDKIKHIRFDSQITAEALETRNNAITRLARTLEVPQEVLLGMSDSNHWSAWQIDESAIKTHIEPMMVIICDALTNAILRPLLRAEGHPNPDGVVVWYDASGLTQRPNRAEDALTLWERGLLSDEAFVSELGFSDNDFPKNEETDEGRKFRLLLAASRSHPALFERLAPLLGIDLPPAPPGYTPPATATPAAPSTAGSPTPTRPAGTDAPGDNR